MGAFTGKHDQALAIHTSPDDQRCLTQNKQAFRQAFYQLANIRLQDSTTLFEHTRAAFAWTYIIRLQLPQPHVTVRRNDGKPVAIAAPDTVAALHWYTQLCEDPILLHFASSEEAISGTVEAYISRYSSRASPAAPSPLEEIMSRLITHYDLLHAA